MPTRQQDLISPKYFARSRARGVGAVRVVNHDGDPCRSTCGRLDRSATKSLLAAGQAMSRHHAASYRTRRGLTDEFGLFMNRAAIDDMLWIASEIFYYLGLVLFAIAIPALSFILWMMQLVNEAHPEFLYLAIAWVLSGAMFVAGIVLKNQLVK
jgi:hypothetical protein